MEMSIEGPAQEAEESKKMEGSRLGIRISRPQPRHTQPIKSARSGDGAFFKKDSERPRFAVQRRRTTEQLTSLICRFHQMSLCLSASNNMEAIVAETPKRVGNLNETEGTNVFFRFLDGQTLCLWIDPSLDIYSIKQTLLAHKARCDRSSPTLVFAAKDIFFVWNGKPLDDEMLLSDYVGTSKDTLITVSYRNRGGCFMVSCTVLGIIILSILGSFCTCGASLLVVPILLPLLFVLPLCCL